MPEGLDTLRVTLGQHGGADQMHLYYEVLETPPAVTWAKLTKKTLTKRDWSFHETMMNLCCTEEKGPYYYEELMRAVNHLNGVRTAQLPVVSFAEITNEYLVHLHQLFEEWFGNRPEEERPLKWEFMKVNNFIHLLEGYLGNRKARAFEDISRGRFWWTYHFKEDLTAPLLEWQHRYFEPEFEFGDLLMGYHTTGKSLYHLYLDRNAESLHRHPPVPQVTINTEVVANFQIVRNKFWEDFYRWSAESGLKENYGVDVNDVRHAVGHIKVAKLKQNFSRQEKIDFIKKMSAFDTIATVQIGRASEFQS